MHRIALLKIVFLMLVMAFHGQAQDTFIMNSDDPPYPCPYTDGAYYHPASSRATTPAQAIWYWWERVA